MIIVVFIRKCKSQCDENFNKGGFHPAFKKLRKISEMSMKMLKFQKINLFLDFKKNIII